MECSNCNQILKLRLDPRKNYILVSCLTPRNFDETNITDEGERVNQNILGLTFYILSDKVISVEIKKEPIVAQCDGCAERVLDPADYVCKRYAMPSSQWRNGKKCAMSTNIKREAVVTAKLNPIKASRRSTGR